MLQDGRLGLAIVNFNENTNLLS